MSEIIERKDSQHLIDVVERKVVFDCGHEMHQVTVWMGETQFEFTRHLSDDNTISKHQGVTVHNMRKTEIKIFEKVKKNAKKFATFVTTKITGVSQ